MSPGTELRPFDDGTGEEHLTLRLRTSLPPGLSLVTQRTYATAVRSALLTIPEVNSVRVRIGRRLSPRLPAPFEMELLLVLKSQQQWRSSTHTDALIDEILKGLASTPGLGPGFDLADASRPESRDLARWRPVGERIQGDDLQQLNRHAMQSFSAAGQTPGVHATRLIPVVGDEPRVDISPDAEALAAHGLTLQALAEHLEVAREGRVVASLVEGGRRVEVVLLAAEPESEGPLSVVRVPMVVPGGTLQLAEVAKVELRPSPAVIERSGSHRSVQLRIAAPGTDAAALIERLKADREKSQLPPGFVITWEPVLDD